MVKMLKGVIIKGLGGLYIVQCGDEVYECRARGIFRKNKIVPTVGDKVCIENDTICEILPRKNSLIRPAVANIDKLFIVIAVQSPDPECFYINKLTAIAEYNNIEPVLIFNKTDLEDKDDIIKLYSAVPYKKHCISTAQNTGAQGIAEELAGGKIAAFAGLSGVGKSSILNLLAKSQGVDFKAEVGKISSNLQGKHTTRHVELFSICGGYIADTPGFGSLEIEYFDIKDRSKLKHCFPEFEEYISLCKFNDCSHTKDLGCAVREMVEKDKIAKHRYESFCRLYEELGEYKPWEN